MSVGRTGLAVLAAVIALLAMPIATSQAGDKLIVFAAASLKNALDGANAICGAKIGGPARVSYAATPALAKQIQQGAPADLFFSADTAWMQVLADEKLIKPETEVKLLSNAIVLIGPAAQSAPVNIAPGFDLASHLGDGRLAIANVDAVPAGRYGKAALETLGIWDAVRDKLAQAENVRAALALVATGEAPLGIVYRTDAHAEPKVTVLATIPADSHPPIVFPVAVTASSTHPKAAAFLECLASPEAKVIFEAEGFAVLGTQPTTN